MENREREMWILGLGAKNEEMRSNETGFTEFGHLPTAELAHYILLGGPRDQ